MTKKALLVGINDYKRVKDLRGCRNDVTNMHNVLKTYFGFKHQDIRVLTDQRATKMAMMDRLEWLVDGARPGDLLVFHFAGHGSQVLDRDELDELHDRKDEILCPWDMDWDGTFITDDTLNRLFRGLEEGVLLEVFLDCCNSGTGTRGGLSQEGEGLSLTPPEEELPENYLVNRYLEPPIDIECRSLGESYPVKGFRSASRSTLNHVLWAGCKDWQESSDTFIDGEYSGAFTYYLCKHIRAANGKITRRDVFTRIDDSLRFNRYRQEPQLECELFHEDALLFSNESQRSTRSLTSPASSRKEVLRALNDEFGLDTLSNKKRKEWFEKKREEWFEIVRTDAFKFFYDPKEGTKFEEFTPDAARGLTGIGKPLGNFFESLERSVQYANKKNKPGACRIVAEGDSWFLHPLLSDIIDCLGKDYAVSCLSAAGDEIRQMLKQNDFVNEIIEEQPQFFLLSGGGNDMLGEEFFKYSIRKYISGTPGEKPARLIDHVFYEKLEEVIQCYHKMLRRLNESPEIANIYSEENPLHILIHGYDYAIPGTVRKGKWLRVKMLEKEIHSNIDHNAVIRHMIDQLNEKLELLPDEFSQIAKFRIHYVDLRGTLEKKADYNIQAQKELWYDEIHPNDEGFRYVAAKFKEEIERIRNSSAE